MELTANLENDYNKGLLSTTTANSISHSSGEKYGKIMQYTAEIVSPESSMKGRTIRLLNSENRYLRAGITGESYDDAIREVNRIFNQATGVFEGVLSTGDLANSSMQSSHNPYCRGRFKASRVVPTADENRPKTQEMTYFMRIA